MSEQARLAPEEASMAELLFEIWEPRDGGIGLWQVSQQSDEAREKVDPGSLLRHSFYASSDFEAHQRYYDWNGWGTWKPEPDWRERQFTHEEAVQQQAYLESRRHPNGDKLR
jgi:hypothetical protein